MDSNGSNGTNGDGQDPSKLGKNLDGPDYSTRFQKGHPPLNGSNKGGRPLGSVSLTTAIRKAIKEEVEVDGVKRPVLDIITESIIKHTVGGSAKHLQQLWDRIDGAIERKVTKNTNSNINIQHEHILNLDALNDAQLREYRTVIARVVESTRRRIESGGDEASSPGS